MIRLLEGLPPNVVGFEGVGEVHPDDYRTVVIPAIGRALAAHDKIRLLHVLGDGFRGYSPAAMLVDSKVGAEHVRRFEKIAIVTDLGWVRHSVHTLGWMIPGDVRVFTTSERSDAEAWVAE
jgi:hypothetical protein